MADTISPEPTPAETTTDAKAEARAKFSKALEEARAGAGVLGKEAQDRATAYADKASSYATATRDKLTETGSEWIEEARAKGNEAKDKALELANEGKARASSALSGLGKIVADNAATVDDSLGEKYGDYARSAAKSIQDAAAKIDSKDLGELGADAKEFVRKSPGLAIGLAAVAGFMVARLFKGSDTPDTNAPDADA